LAGEVHLMPLQGIDLALPQSRRHGKEHGEECRRIGMGKLPVRFLEKYKDYV
jgi:hypothetical protein